MNDEIKIKPQVVTPLKKICMSIGELPTSYLETMTYYEMLVWFTNFLRDQVIPVVNNNGEAVAELQNLFIELQTYVNEYFDNLDVQEEINNKLDAMLEDGTLEQIIEQFIQSSALWIFDTVNDMKEATNLIKGSYAKTLGYYEINDGGAAIYKITDEESEAFHQEEIQDNLYANLIPSDIADIKQLGAKENDSTFDNSAIINKALSLYKEIQINGEYYINDEIEMNHDNIIYSYRKTRINDTSDSSYTFRISAEAESTYRSGINKNYFVSFDKFFIHNHNTSINKIGILIKSSTSSYPYEGIIDGITIYNYDIGIKVELQNYYLNELNHVHIEQCRIGLLLGEETSGSQTISNSGENIRIEDCLFTKCNLAIYTNIKDAVFITNSSFDFNGLGFYNTLKVNISCSNCHFETFGRYGTNTISYNNIKGLVKDTFYSSSTANSNYQFINCEIVHYNRSGVDNYNDYYIMGQGNYILTNCTIQTRKEVFNDLKPLADHKVVKTNNINYTDQLQTRIIDTTSLIDKNFTLSDSALKYYEAGTSSSNYSVEDGVITITSTATTETGISFISKNKIYDLKNFIIADVLFKPVLDWNNSNISNYIEFTIRYYDNTDTVIGTQWGVSSTDINQTTYNSTYGQDYTGFISCKNPAIKPVNVPENTQYARINMRLLLRNSSLESRTVQIKSPIIQFV